MRYRKWYEWLLTLTYVGLVTLCFWLNLFTANGTQDPVNLAVNIGMFVIVGFVFIRCDLTCLFPTDRLVTDVEAATRVIRKEALSTDADHLWAKLRDRRDLFAEPELQDLYADFLRETERSESSLKEHHPAGEIEAFIHPGLSDRWMHRGLLNQVPGALTGLGILGTFIGLSLGLASFATGSTAEITDSIAPLMGGIKVAFHTSIYGMVFSLVFNYVYHRRLTEAENALEDFVDAWHTYVLPNTDSDRLRLLLESEDRQATALRELSSSIGSAMARELSLALEPQFARFDRTLASFADASTKSQTEAVRSLVNTFIKEMDRSMSGAFSRLSTTIDEETKLQRDNAQLIRGILDENQASAQRYNTWLEEQAKTMRDLHNLVGQLPQSTEHTAHALQEALHNSEVYFNKMQQELNAAVETKPAQIAATYASLEATLVETTQAMDALTDALRKTSGQPRRKGGLFNR